MTAAIGVAIKIAAGIQLIGAFFYSSSLISIASFIEVVWIFEMSVSFGCLGMFLVTLLFRYVLKAVTWALMVFRDFLLNLSGQPTVFFILI